MQFFLMTAPIQVQCYVYPETPSEGDVPSEELESEGKCITCCAGQIINPKENSERPFFLVFTETVVCIVPIVLSLDHLGKLAI